MKACVFLDRDGVVNPMRLREGVWRAPYSVDEFELFPGVVQAVSTLRSAGYAIVVATNQPDVSRGWVGRPAIDAIHLRLKELIWVDAIKVCFHDTSDNCACRKPRAGMLLEAAIELKIDLAKSFMIGDRQSDLAAGKAAGCKTILIGPNGTDRGLADAIVSSLLEAVKIILC